MNQRNVKAGRAWIEIAADSTMLGRNLRAASTQLGTFRSSVLSIGSQLAAVFSGAALGGSVLGAISSFASAGSELSDMSQRTGVAAETLSEYALAAKMSDTSMESLGKGFQKMQVFMVDAAKGSKENNAALDDLGVSMRYLARMSPAQQFEAFAESIARINDPAVKTAYAMKVFGKSGVDLIPLLQNGKAGLQSFREEAHRLGLSMSNEDASAAEEMGDSIDKLRMSLGAAYNKIGAALAPSITSLAEGFSSAVSVVTKWLNINRGIIAVVTPVLAVLGTLGATIAGLGLGFGAIATMIGPVVITVLGTMASAFATLTLPVIAIGAAIGGITVAMNSMGLTWSDVLSYIGNAWVSFTNFIGLDKFTTDFVGGFKWMFEGAKEYFGAIGQALSSGNLEGAVNVAMAGLARAFRGGFNVAYEYYLDFQEVLLGSWDWLKTRLSQGFINAWYGIESVFSQTISVLLKGWNIFSSSIMIGWHNTIGFIKKAWVRLKGVFDKDVNVDAEVKKIDQETVSKTNSSREEFDKYQKEVEARRAKAVKDAAQNAVGANKILEDERNKRTNDRLNRRNALMSEADAKYNLAKAEYDGVLAELKGVNPSVGPKPNGKPVFNPDELNLDNLLSRSEDAKNKIESKGTFSAFTALAGGLKSDSIDKVAQNTANTNLLLKQIANKPGVVFT